MHYFNDSVRRTGTLWEGRYKASLVEDDHYLMTCYRSIELNPVRAGMVAKPSSEMDRLWIRVRDIGVLRRGLPVGM